MPGPRPKSKTDEPGPLKYWTMIVFESLGVGALVIMLVLAAVLVLVGVYVQIVWPLTDWDMVSVSLEPYRSLITTSLFSIFLAASAAGFWFISGAAWRTVKPTSLARGVPPKRPPSQYRSRA
ncbi:MAG TPA: hypothetical protein VMT28_12965 [Terriglobales bacterium]|jgi:hypothetical protein|nr:hypothetical protein [Terriglobales bacterium]